MYPNPATQPNEMRTIHSGIPAPEDTTKRMLRLEEPLFLDRRLLLIKYYIGAGLLFIYYSERRIQREGVEADWEREIGKCG